MSELTTTQREILEAAANRPDGSIYPMPSHLKGGAAKMVIASLIKKNLIKQAMVDIRPDVPIDWRINGIGLRAIGQPKYPKTLEIKTWDEHCNYAKANVAPSEPTNTIESKPRRTRENTKQAQVIALLKRPEGATVAQIAEVTEWRNHTIRGFLSIAKKKFGLTITAQRTRIVGANQQGSPGSWSTYFAG